MAEGKNELLPSDVIVEALRACAKPFINCPNCILGGVTGLCSNALKEVAADLIEAQQKEIQELKAANRWIPVTEGPPKEFVSVLVCIPSDDPLPTVKEAYLADGMWVAKACYYSQEEVTHWQPMPKGVEEMD